jgi:hypothetical protein
VLFFLIGKMTFVTKKNQLVILITESLLNNRFLCTINLNHDKIFTENLNSFNK